MQSISNFENSLYYSYSKRISLLFIFFLLLYETSTYIANDMIMPGMIDVVNSFHAGTQWVSSSLTAFIFGGASLQIFLGPLSDRFGRRPVMLFGVGFFLICTILITFTQNIHSFIVARFFQGMGLCFISVIGYATLHEIFYEVYAVRLIAIMSNITILAPLTGPLLGSFILLFFSWHMIFYILSFTSLLALIGLWLYMPETIGVKKNDGSTIVLTSIHPKVVKNNYVALYKNKRFMSGAIAAGILNVPLIAWIGLSPIILIKHFNFTVQVYALLQVPIFLSIIIGNLYLYFLSTKYSLAKLASLGSKVTIASLILFPLLVWSMNASYLSLIFGICIYSFSLGFTTTPLNRMTLFSTLVPKGTASAKMSIIMMLLTGVGNQIAGWSYNNRNFNFALFCLSCGVLYLITFNIFKTTNAK